jgi:hypothetical protein
MNDNLVSWEGPQHLYATDLLNALMILMSNAAKEGLDRTDEDGLIYNWDFWAGECAKALNVQKVVD